MATYDNWSDAVIHWMAGQIASHVPVNDITEKPGHKKCCNKRIRLVVLESTLIQVQTGKEAKITDIMMEISGAKVVAQSIIDNGETYITKGFSGLGNFAKTLE